MEPPPITSFTYQGLLGLRRHGREVPRILCDRLPSYGAADHRALAARHLELAAECDSRWMATANEAAQALWGRPWSLTDYQVSGIGRNEFSSTHKNTLRTMARSATMHRDCHDIHLRAARSCARRGIK